MSDLILKIRQYLGILEFYDERFRTYIDIGDGHLTVRLFCLDPSQVLDVCMARAKASILFSATLTPLDYFVDVLGGTGKAGTLSLASPFDPDALGLVAVTHISTRYEDREKSAGQTAACIAAAIMAKRGNYIVYFPSYHYLEAVAARFTARFPKVRTILQKRGMSAAEKEEFLSAFREDSDVLRVGFCVLGGSFSEGVDLPGRRLIGSIVVGVGLPQLSSERNIIRDFYETAYERGYDYAYTYPGMNKVLQACGRVIRREEDTGLVVLIDDRYDTPAYRALMPSHWEHLHTVHSVAELADYAKAFWQKREPPAQESPS